MSLSSDSRLGHRLRSPLGDQRGFSLVEVLVSALLLVVVGLAVYSSLDGASASSGRIKARAIASGLAQADQERLRAFRHTALFRYDETYTRAAAGVLYTVTSHAEWVGDQGATATCTSGDNGADYIEIVSSVSWPALRTGKPIVQRSLIAPNSGGLAVQVNNRNAVGVAGVQVATSGAGSFTDFTNSSGCVVFGPLQSGNYTVTLNSGCIDSQGTSPVTDSTTVQENTRTTMVLDCDTGGRVTVASVTRPYRTNAPVGIRPAQPDQVHHVALAHPNLAAPFAKFFGTGTEAPSIQSSLLFPFTSPYAAYSGNCIAADPGDPRYAASGDVRISQLVAPGGAHAVTVNEPALNVRSHGAPPANNTPLNNTRVYAYVRTPGCPVTRLDLGLTDALGLLVRPGVPYGDYDVCMERSGRARTVTGLRAYDFDNTTLTDFRMDNAANGSCPP